MNPKDIHILPKVISGIVSTGINGGIVSTGINGGIVSTGINGSIIITGVETCPSCDDGLTVGEADGVGVLRLGVVRLGAVGVLDIVRLGVARAFACPVEGVLGFDVGFPGDGVRVDVLFDLALNLLLL